MNMIVSRACISACSLSGHYFVRLAVVALCRYIGGHPNYQLAGMQSTTPFTGCMTDISFSMDFGAPRHVKSLDGHYEVVPHPMPWQQAQQYCAQNDYDLASIHSSQEQQLAADQCSRFTQASTAVESSACLHQLANGDINIASTTWISNDEDCESPHLARASYNPFPYPHTLT